jgi:hypothetical protein
MAPDEAREPEQHSRRIVSAVDRLAGSRLGCPP